jgi:predicted transglutaminase-like cysteine proteinase
MFAAVRRLAFSLLTLAASSLAMPPASSAQESGRFIRVGAPTLTPIGWADFCYRYRSECAGGATTPTEIEATPANLGFIDLINRMVNRDVEPKSDMEHWHVVDRWDLPTDGFGDCEDYALLKRKLLIEAGLPRQALLITIVRDEMDEGHAVLTVRTTRGDLILDNMSERVKLWSRTPYRFVKRQSQEDQNAWVSIGSAIQSARVLVVPAPTSAGRIASR